MGLPEAAVPNNSAETCSREGGADGQSGAETQQEAVQDLTAQKIAAEEEAQMVKSDAEKMASVAAALEAEFVTLQKQFSEVLRSVPELSVSKHTTLATVN